MNNLYIRITKGGGDEQSGSCYVAFCFLESHTYAVLNNEPFPAVANSVVVWTVSAGGVVIRCPVFLTILPFHLSHSSAFHISAVS